MSRERRDKMELGTPQEMRRKSSVDYMKREEEDLTCSAERM
tara:strand:- start:20 stop:142 length:123 start_codon:yes stop_codon:yes gene_type:complete